MDPHLGKRYSGFAHKTNPQAHRTVLVTVTVRVIINLTETLIIILSKITYLAVSIRISKHIYRTTDVIFELITKIWMLFSTMLTNSWTRYSWINEILLNGESIEVHIGHYFVSLIVILDLPPFYPKLLNRKLKWDTVGETITL